MKLKNHAQPISLFLTAFSLFFSLIFLQNCNPTPFDEFNTEGGNSRWAVPLVNAEKSFGDIIKDFDAQSFVEIRPDGNVILRYRGNFVARNTLDIFASLRDLQNKEIPALLDTLPIPLPATNGVFIDYADIKSGVFPYNFISSEPLTVTLSIPQLLQNGVPFSRTIPLNGTVKDSVSLKGMRLIPGTVGGINIIVIARRANGQQVKLTAGSFYMLKDFEVAYVTGFFGTAPFEIPADTIKIDFFKRWELGEVRFTDPRMIVSLDNSFGVPVKAVTKQADVVALNGDRLKITSPLVDNGVTVNYPRMNEVGQSKRTIAIFDKTNSNLADLISLNPVRIEYDIDGLLNPESGDRTPGFLLDTSSFRFQLELEVPTKGTAKNFTITDTFNINFDENSKITDAELSVQTINGMPIELGLQGIFLNDKGAIIDSFYQNNTPILRGSPVGSNGLPTGNTTTESKIKLDATKFDKVRKAKKIAIRYIFSTANNGSIPVILTAQQKVQVKLGARFGLIN